jgi:hypothetical protein
MSTVRGWVVVIWVGRAHVESFGSRGCLVRREVDSGWEIEATV